MSHFPAQFPGRCGSCGDPFQPGTPVFYAGHDDFVTVVECCADAEGRPTAEVTVPADRVMPRGRRARDRCDRCFIVPASNGVCGC